MNDYIFNFEDLPSTNTPINSYNLEEMQKKILDSVYPIGRGFIDFTNTDYSNYLGFTWERELVGLTPVGYDASDEDFDTIGAIGGEKTHTLTIDEMPNHNHILEMRNCSAIDSDTSQPTEPYYPKGTNWNSSSEWETSFLGNNKPHNNMPPYKVVAYWKRTA